MGTEKYFLANANITDTVPLRNIHVVLTLVCLTFLVAGAHWGLTPESSVLHCMISISCRHDWPKEQHGMPSGRAPFQCPYRRPCPKSARWGQAPARAPCAAPQAAGSPFRRQEPRAGRGNAPRCGRSDASGPASQAAGSGMCPVRSAWKPGDGGEGRPPQPQKPVCSCRDCRWATFHGGVSVGSRWGSPERADLRTRVCSPSGHGS